MNCPKCHGTGLVLREFSQFSQKDFMEHCDYGCINGIIHCCDGEDVDQQKDMDECLTHIQR
jgi:hypothetical protein